MDVTSSWRCQPMPTYLAATPVHCATSSGLIIALMKKCCVTNIWKFMHTEYIVKTILLIRPKPKDIGLILAKWNPCRYWYLKIIPLLRLP